MEQMLLSIEGKGGEEIRLIKKEYRGALYLDCRKYRGTGNNAVPTTKGLMVDMKTWGEIVPAITAALE